MIFKIIYTVFILGTAFLLTIIGRTIAQGKGDSLISGYNTLPKEKKAEYDIGRLRHIVSTVCYIDAGLIALLSMVVYLPEKPAILATSVLTALILIVSITIAVNTDKRAKK